MSSGADPTQRRERFPFSCHICGRRSVVMRGRGPGEQEPADLGCCSLCGRWACPDHYTGIFRAGRAGTGGPPSTVVGVPPPVRRCSSLLVRGTPGAGRLPAPGAVIRRRPGGNTLPASRVTNLDIWFRRARHSSWRRGV
jgi:hypothetical protein